MQGVNTGLRDGNGTLICLIANYEPKMSLHKQKLTETAIKVKEPERKRHTKFII